MRIRLLLVLAVLALLLVSATPVLADFNHENIPPQSVCLAPDAALDGLYLANDTATFPGSHVIWARVIDSCE